MRALSVVENQPDIWHESMHAEIKKMFAKDLSEHEFSIFVGMGRATGLNPWLREIWAVKYDKTKPAQIFIGRDGYRVSAQRNPTYDFHTTDAVYSNDKFRQKNGDIDHEYNLQDRGKLLGGYGLAGRKGASRPSYVFVPIEEYDTGLSLWREAKGGKKETMIKKVAEAQVVRMCWQEVYGGSYHEYEAWREADEVRNTKPPTKGLTALEEKFGLQSADESKQSPVETLRWLLDTAGTLEELTQIQSRAKSLSTADKALFRGEFIAKRQVLEAQIASRQEQGMAF